MEMVGVAGDVAPGRVGEVVVAVEYPIQVAAFPVKAETLVLAARKPEVDVAAVAQIQPEFLAQRLVVRYQVAKLNLGDTTEIIERDHHNWSSNSRKDSHSLSR